MKTKHFLLVAIALVHWNFVWAASRPPTPPIILPFAAERAGSRITTELQVVEPLTYTFSLRLGFKKNDPGDRKRIKKIAGGFGKDRNGNLVEPGIGIPLKLTIRVVDSTGDKYFLEKIS